MFESVKSIDQRLGDVHVRRAISQTQVSHLFIGASILTSVLRGGRMEESSEIANPISREDCLANKTSCILVSLIKKRCLCSVQCSAVRSMQSKANQGTIEAETCRSKFPR